HTEPVTDLTLLRPRDDFYCSGHPTPADAYVVIEVTDTTAAYDRSVKLPLYARASVTEAWLVDLNQDRVEVHRRPRGGVHSEIQIRARGESIAPEAFPDVVLAVDDILGEANR